MFVLVLCSVLNSLIYNNYSTVFITVAMSVVFILPNIVYTQNLDGGGSSVSVKDGKVIDKPTCMDTSLVCERPVTSITCMHDS